MAEVELLLPALPEHVRTARLVTVAAARRAGLADGLVDELRLAVGEATARAMGLHARHAPDQRVRITVADGPLGLTVAVHDCGPEAGPAVDDVTGSLLEGNRDGGAGRMDDDLADPDVALALVLGLVDEVEVVTAPGAGTVVSLRWPLVRRPLTSSAAARRASSDRAPCPTARPARRPRDAASYLCNAPAAPSGAAGALSRPGLTARGRGSSVLRPGGSCPRSRPSRRGAPPPSPAATRASSSGSSWSRSSPSASPGCSPGRCSARARAPRT